MNSHVKRLTEKRWMSLLLGVWFLGCQTPQDEDRHPVTEAVAKEEPFGIEAVWFKGSLEDAFRTAQKEGQLIFLYWGAVWCPYCNEMKDQIFSQPRFAALMRDKVAVYLDGDSERAQIWGEKLQASGYPTILVMSPEKKELIRISGAVDMQEFEAGLASLTLNTPDTRALLAKLRSGGRLTNPEWSRLAMLSWGQLPSDQFPATQVEGALWIAVNSVPADRRLERAQLIAEYLSTIASRPQTTQRPPSDRLLQQAQQWLRELLADPDTSRSIRNFIAHESGNVMAWLSPHVSRSSWEGLRDLWLESARRLREDPLITSVDLKLWLTYPELEFFRLQETSKRGGSRSREEKRFELLKKKVEGAVVEANRLATTRYQRHSMVSGAAFLLRQVGSYERAERLLLEELKSTDTPWYYYSGLANLAKELGQNKKALHFASQAAASASGRATKLQWATSELLLYLELGNDQKKAELSTEFRTKLSAFYGLVLSLDDGFSGRNRRRLKALDEALKPYRSDARLQALWKQNRSECGRLPTTWQQECRQYFAKSSSSSIQEAL